jgi:hypothetical protein
MCRPCCGKRTCFIYICCVLSEWFCRFVQIFGFVVICCRSHYLPILALLAIFLNGILVKFSRSYTHITVWNDGFAPPPFMSDSPSKEKDSSSNRIVSAAFVAAEPISPASGDRVSKDQYVSGLATPQGSQQQLQQPSLTFGDAASMRRLVIEYYTLVNQSVVVLEVR